MMSNEAKSLCKGCDEQFITSNEQIERILAKPSMQNPETIVPDHIYNERLAKCKDCAHLWQKETCLLCGCFVRISAKFKSKSCPDIKNKQWDALTST